MENKLLLPPLAGIFPSFCFRATSHAAEHVLGSLPNPASIGSARPQTGKVEVNLTRCHQASFSCNILNLRLKVPTAVGVAADVHKPHPAKLQHLEGQRVRPDALLLGLESWASGSATAAHVKSLELRHEGVSGPLEGNPQLHLCGEGPPRP